MPIFLACLRCPAKMVCRQMLRTALRCFPSWASLKRICLGKVIVHWRYDARGKASSKRRTDYPFPYHQRISTGHGHAESPSALWSRGGRKIHLWRAGCLDGDTVGRAQAIAAGVDKFISTPRCPADPREGCSFGSTGTAGSCVVDSAPFISAEECQTRGCLWNHAYSMFSAKQPPITWPMAKKKPRSCESDERERQRH